MSPVTHTDEVAVNSAVRLVPVLGQRDAQLTGPAAVFASIVLLALSMGASTALTLLAAVAAGADHGPGPH